ncbi:hypothetical protein EFM27_10460 [Lactiplantibacillus plantarum]|nr:hypothetical protein [Lactiplantibacillus plantarum]
MLLSEKSGLDPLSFVYPNVTNSLADRHAGRFLRTVGIRLGAFLIRRALGEVTLRKDYKN